MIVIKIITYILVMATICDAHWFWETKPSSERGIVEYVRHNDEVDESLKNIQHSYSVEDYDKARGMYFLYSFFFKKKQ
jgi:hypothetical protein